MEKIFKIIFITLLVFTHTFCRAQSNPAHQKVSVLFIGNSYVYSNDLPLMVDSLAAANGDTLIHAQYTPGGYSLFDHSNDAQAIAAIQQQQWDYVILQEQSQRPSLDTAYVNANVIPPLLYLDSLIKQNNPCTQIILFETWGRRYGDASNCPAYPPVCTYSGMQQRLKESYKIMADTVAGIMAPVGQAFGNMMQYDSTVVLYVSDNSHPSVEGTYLAACVFQKILFHRNPVGNSYTAGIPLTTSQKLQLIAQSTVDDSLNFWNLGTNEPWASFVWNQVDPTGLTAFTSVSDSGFTHYWNFGDSTTSNDANPIHQYTYSHYFPVMHVVCNSCICDTFILTNNIVIFPSPVYDIDSDRTLLVFPNPVSSSFVTISVTHKSLSVPEFYCADGKRIEIKMKLINDNWIADFQSVPSGVYFVRINTKNSLLIRKIVKL